jgi:hypothetical protein
MLSLHHQPEALPSLNRGLPILALSHGALGGVSCQSEIGNRKWAMFVGRGGGNRTRTLPFMRRMLFRLSYSAI